MGYSVGALLPSAPRKFLERGFVVPHSSLPASPPAFEMCFGGDPFAFIQNGGLGCPQSPYRQKKEKTNIRVHFLNIFLCASRGAAVKTISVKIKIVTNPLHLQRVHMFGTEV